MTRLQIRQAVGFNLGGYKLITAIAGGSTTTFLTNDLWGGADDHNGKWLHAPTLDPTKTYRVVDSSVTAYVTTLTFHPAATSIVAANTAELFEMRFDPLMIHGFINQAIIEVTGLAFDPEESLALHGDGRQRRFDIPDEFAMVNGIYLRKSVTGAEIHQCATAWDDAVDADFTVTVDTKDYKLASGSMKIVVAATVSDGDLMTDDISSLDLSGYDYVEFWIKATAAVVASDLYLLLDNVADCASPQETLVIPALVADTWTFVRVALANPELDTAIISVGLEYNANSGANTIWLSDIKAVKDDSGYWVKMDRNNWHVDQEARQLVMEYAPGYYLIKLTGGDKPVLLDADATVCEVDEEFVIARATELALLSAGGGPGTDPDALRSLASYWGNIADRAKRSMPWLVGVRTVG